MRYALDEKLIIGEGMPESDLHIPRWLLDQSQIFSVVIVKWFAFLNKRPQRGRDGHCGNEVGTLQRGIEIQIASHNSIDLVGGPSWP